MKAVFLRAFESDDKANTLRCLICGGSGAPAGGWFEADTESFTAIPRSPFSYWVSDQLRGLFTELPSLEGNARTAKVGLQTSEDSRFVRCWWEPHPEQSN